MVPLIDMGWPAVNDCPFTGVLMVITGKILSLSLSLFLEQENKIIAVNKQV